MPVGFLLAGRVLAGRVLAGRVLAGRVLAGRAISCRPVGPVRVRRLVLPGVVQVGRPPPMSRPIFPLVLRGGDRSP